MLALTNVTYTYPGAQHPALDSLSLSLDDRDRLGLLGLNGAGKSTLVALLMGVQEPSSGKLLINGKPAKLGRCDVGFVPQDYAFYNDLSIKHNLEYFASLVYPSSSRNRRNAVARVVEQCELDDILTRLAGQCSGGEKRRLNLAIALLRLPSLLILDEPTANVDPRARSLIVNLVEQLSANGMTIVYTSHLLSEVERLCNKIALVHKGELLRYGLTERLLNQGEEKLSLTTATNLSEIQTATLRERLGEALTIDQRVCLIDLTQSTLTLTDTVSLFAQLSIELCAISTQSGSLEQFFLELTQRASEEVQ